MHPGANAPNSTSEERLTPLFERHAELMATWQEIVLTPTGRVRAKLSADQQIQIKEIQGLTRAIEREINQIVKEA